MQGQDVKIAATESGTFDCYLSLPASGPAPALVIMSSIFGADGDVRDVCDELADRGFVVAAPDLFWRSDAGPMPRTAEGRRRAAARAKDRDASIERGVQDLADVMADLKGRPECNGRVAVVGLCYGGPYAILGPARLGCDAGLSFHGTKVENYLGDLDKVRVPLSLHWGDNDHAAPPETLEQVQSAIRDMPNVDMVIYPGAAHGYTAASAVDVWHEEASQASWRRAVEILNDLQNVPEAANA